MARPTFPRLLTLVTALAAAVSFGACPSLAEGPHGGGPAGHGVGGLPGIPGVGGGGFPGGPIVGGPIGAGPIGSFPGGFPGTGFGSPAPLSPWPDSGRRGPDNPVPGGLSPLSPGRSGEDTSGQIVKRLDSQGREAAKDLEHRGGEKGHDAESAVAAAAEDTVPPVSVLTQARAQQAQRLIRQHRDVVEADPGGYPVVRGQILAIAPSPEVLAKAQRAGFRVQSSQTEPELGLSSVVLLGPRGVSAVEAIRRLRALDPQGQYDFNHLYQESGVVSARAAAKTPAAATREAAELSGVKVGLVDGTVAGGQPALAGAQLVQRAFAPGGAKPSAHATAVASLIAGHQGPFRGAAPGATLYVADVYGTTPTGGSAEAIVRALAWLAAAGPPVINISLVGPPNLLLEAAVKALIAKGRLVVAAVGNDGPAAPPLYPASYAGVVAVTAVDARRHVLPEASRGTHIDFAAPGADMAAAGVDGGFVSVRGTSFAAPIAAGLLARHMTAASPANGQRAMAALGRQALDLGNRGRDPQFGRGLVGADLRTPPAQVQARYALRGP